jgi:adenine-specific DNA-methyltransferase
LKIPKVNKVEWDEEYNLIIPDITEEDITSIEEWIENNESEKINSYFSNKDILSLKEYARQNNVNLSLEWKNRNSYKIFASKPNTAIRNKALEFDFSQRIYAIPNQR